MKSKFILLALLMAAAIAADEAVNKIYAAYSRGELTEARRLLKQLSPTSTRDGNRLFINAVFESDPNRARNLLYTCLKSDLDGRYVEEAHFRLIQLAEALGDTAEVIERANVFLSNWENSRYREPILMLMAAHSRQGSDEEKRYLELVIEESPGSYFGQSARLVKAHEAFNIKHYKTAEKECRRINNAPGDELVPASLILLSRIGLQQNQTERALLNYNILREQYSHAIGQEDLVVALKGISEKQSGQESSEVFEGITYSVQVGVFGVKDNARDMSDRVEAYGYKARIVTREISGNNYYVVLGGKFRTMKEAQSAREKLELGENEVFKVVVND